MNTGLFYILETLVTLWPYMSNCLCQLNSQILNLVKASTFFFSYLSANTVYYSQEKIMCSYPKDSCTPFHCIAVNRCYVTIPRCTSQLILAMLYVFITNIHVSLFFCSLCAFDEIILHFSPTAVHNRKRKFLEKDSCHHYLRDLPSPLVWN